MRNLSDLLVSRRDETPLASPPTISPPVRAKRNRIPDNTREESNAPVKMIFVGLYFSVSPAVLHHEKTSDPTV